LLVVPVEMLVPVEMQLMELLDLLVTQDPKVMPVTQALTVLVDLAELQA
jgi:hypothetical protein